MSFFGKILGKSQDSHRPIEKVCVDLENLPNEWGSFSTLIDDRMASIRLNLALNSIAPYSSYTYALRLRIAILKVDPETGFPDYDEFSNLNLIEDRLSEAMKRIAAIYVGVVITDGHIEFYYYLKDRERHMPIIAQVMEQFSKYQYSSATLVDPDWKQSFDFLYPNEYEYQSILNQRIWYRLDKEGDDHSQLREITHQFSFETYDDRVSFMGDASALDYDISSRKKEEGDPRPYKLEISRFDTTELPSINQHVWELIEISKKYNGKYSGWSCNVV